MASAEWSGRRSESWPFFATTIFVVAVAVGIAAFDIAHASVDVVFSDTWGYIRMVDGFLSGAFAPSEILRAHNQNRSAVLVGALLASAKFDHFNQKNIEYLGVVFASLTLANVIYLIFVLFENRPLEKAIVAEVASLVVFSLVQCENFLLSINFVFFSTVAFSVTSIVVTARCVLGDDSRLTKAGLFVAAVILSELALLSMGGGVVVWVVNLVQIGLAIVLFQARAVGALLAYLAVAMVSVGAYLWGLNAGGSLSVLLSKPLEGLAFFVIGTGNSVVGLFVQGSHLGPILWLDFLVGLVLDLILLFVLAYFVSLPRDEKKRSLPLIALILFGVLEQALIAYGRLPLGLSNAATARYSTLTLIAPMVALIFLTLYADVSRVCMTLATLTGLVMLLFTIVSDRNELRIASGRLYLGNLRQKILLDAKIGEEERRILEWELVSDIQQGNAALKKHRLSFYHAQ